MATNNVISRTDGSALIPEEVASDIIGKTIEQSIILTKFKRIPVRRAQVRMPILSALPVAYFVNGDSGQKQTTEINWANKFLNIEEVACILPIPDSVANDVDADLWGEAKPLIAEAIGRVVDNAFFFGVNKPSSWPSDIYSAAVSAGNYVNEGASVANGGIQDDLDQTFGKVEDDGFDVNGIVAATSLKGKLRRARDSQGRRLDGVSPDLKEYLGASIDYPMRGLFPTSGGSNTNTRAFVGDWSQFICGVRQDITFEMFREGIIQDSNGEIVFNLMQQDMQAMRIVMRIGVQVSNYITNDQPVEANRYPVAVMRF